MYCINCGTEVKETNVYCTNCGYRIARLETKKSKRGLDDWCTCLFILGIISIVMKVIVEILYFEHLQDSYEGGVVYFLGSTIYQWGQRGGSFIRIGNGGYILGITLSFCILYGVLSKKLYKPVLGFIWSSLIWNQIRILQQTSMYGDILLLQSLNIILHIGVLCSFILTPVFFEKKKKVLTIVCCSIWIVHLEILLVDYALKIINSVAIQTCREYYSIQTMLMILWLWIFMRKQLELAKLEEEQKINNCLIKEDTSGVANQQ